MLLNWVDFFAFLKIVSGNSLAVNEGEALIKGKDPRRQGGL